MGGGFCFVFQINRGERKESWSVFVVQMKDGIFRAAKVVHKMVVLSAGL